MKLSQNFSLSEFTFSPTAQAKRINNQPNSEQIANLKALCEKVLEPVRAQFGKPIKISSGYRSPALNRAIGGSLTSQHSKGEAADFEIAGVPNRQVAEWISENLDYDQCILEYYNPKEGPNSGWIHVSFKRNGSNRKQNLIASKNGKKTTYVGVVDFK